MRTTRLGCTPGGGCCDSCGGHTGPPLGAAVDHVHEIPSSRNVALRSALGSINCDQDGNCYDDSTGTYTPAPVTTAGISGMSNTTLYLVGAAVLIGLLELTSRRR